jgi:hypothetical protein
MRLIETYETFTAILGGEDWEPISGKRILPENDIDKDALEQVWRLQCNKGWALDERQIPWDTAKFGTSVEWGSDGFATTVVYLDILKFNPMRILESTVVVPTIVVYWLWEHEKICAWWTVGEGAYNTSQTNKASYPIVFC